MQMATTTSPDSGHMPENSSQGRGGISPLTRDAEVAYNYVVAELNPIRYRGYFRDAETGFYFCQTRYYCPQWRRFINADVLFVAGNPLTASNMYAYCDGNPVMFTDPTGMDTFTDFLLLWFSTGFLLMLLVEMGMSEEEAKKLIENTLENLESLGATVQQMVGNLSNWIESLLTIENPHGGIDDFFVDTWYGFDIYISSNTLKELDKILRPSGTVASVAAFLLTAAGKAIPGVNIAAAALVTTRRLLLNADKGNGVQIRIIWGGEDAVPIPFWIGSQ